ncbi:uncharacterized protein LOC130670480 isoform X2 [Microplitis mediator]|nr:uncharacterized protein LOC130670480 isoform X2 [Microplitis mediator]
MSNKNDWDSVSQRDDNTSKRKKFPKNFSHKNVGKISNQKAHNQNIARVPRCTSQDSRYFYVDTQPEVEQRTVQREYLSKLSKIESEKLKQSSSMSDTSSLSSNSTEIVSMGSKKKISMIDFYSQHTKDIRRLANQINDLGKTLVTLASSMDDRIKKNYLFKKEKMKRKDEKKNMNSEIDADKKNLQKSQIFKSFDPKVFCDDNYCKLNEYSNGDLRMIRSNFIGCKGRQRMQKINEDLNNYVHKNNSFNSILSRESLYEGQLCNDALSSSKKSIAVSKSAQRNMTVDDYRRSGDCKIKKKNKKN